MTKGDKYQKEILQRILDEGCLDKNPRPVYADGTPAHTLSVNHGMCTYDLTKNESPLVTLRPIAVKTSIAEILWIYQKESNDLVVFDELLGKNTWEENHEINNWWKDWALKDENGDYLLNKAGHPYIGACYGETIRKHKLVKKLIKDIKENPDGRRHIISMWQEADFAKPHGLKPCAFLTQWNVRHGKDGIDYLDMCLTQRSSDFATAGCINQVQYIVLLNLIARHLDLTPGTFTWFYNNIQIYDRHVEQAKELIRREPVECEPKIWLNPDKKNFYDYMKKNGLDFDDVDDVSKLPKFIVEMSKNIDTFNHFNNVLYTLNKENKINIVDSIIILVTDYLEPNQVKKLLDEMNFYLLTNELKKRYKIGKIDTGMFEFFG